MSPAHVEVIVYDLHRQLGKTAKEHDFVVQRSRHSGLQGHMESIDTNSERTVIRFSSFKRYGGIPSRSDYQLEGNAQDLRTIEKKRPNHDCPFQDLYVLTISLIGEGSRYIWRNTLGSAPIRLPDVVRVTHQS